jgi:hypothetical protein
MNYLKEIRKNEAIIEEQQEKIKILTASNREIIRNSRIKILEAQDQFLKDNKLSRNHYISDFWECKASPLEMCVFKRDQCEDYCIYCGEPEERK